MAYGTGEKNALPASSSSSSHGPSPSRTAASSRSFRQCTRLRLKNGSGSVWNSWRYSQMTVES